MAKEEGTKVIKFRLPEKLPPEVVREFKHLVEETRRTGREHAASLCLTKDGRLVVGRTCSGSECLVMPPTECRTGTIRIGHFHTHPNASTIWSVGDVQHKLAENYHDRNYVFNCLGSPKVEYFVCHILRRRDKNTVAALYRALNRIEHIGEAKITIRSILPSVIYDKEGQLIPIYDERFGKAVQEICEAELRRHIEYVSPPDKWIEWFKSARPDEGELREAIKKTLRWWLKQVRKKICDEITAMFGPRANPICHVHLRSVTEQVLDRLTERFMDNILRRASEVVVEVEA